MEQEARAAGGRTALVMAGFAMASMALVGGVAWTTLEEGGAGHGAWTAIAYAAGLSMIVLPCTLPLVFVIVPMSMGRGHRRGLAMAGLFGAGLVITITAYASAVAAVGQAASLDTATSAMFGLAGALAYAFGLSQLGIITLRLPTYSGMPRFMRERGDLARSFLMGILLGNAGVGCPNPMFYWLLAHVATVGSVELGASLGAVHGVGRAVPLVLVSVLAMLGVDATRRLVGARLRLERVTGATLVALGAFLLINALPSGHAWYEQTVVHGGWNALVAGLGMPPELSMRGHAHDIGALLPTWAVPPMLVALLVAPACAWVASRSRRRPAP